MQHRGVEACFLLYYSGVWRDGWVRHACACFNPHACFSIELLVITGPTALKESTLCHLRAERLALACEAEQHDSVIQAQHILGVCAACTAHSSALHHSAAFTYSHCHLPTICIAPKVLATAFPLLRCIMRPGATHNCAGAGYASAHRSWPVQAPPIMHKRRCSAAQPHCTATTWIAPAPQALAAALES